MPSRGVPFFFRPPADYDTMTEDQQLEWAISVVRELKRRSGDAEDPPEPASGAKQEDA
jgi:hypothetical protein